MTKAQFIALGLTDELAQACANASTEELKAYVPLSKHDEVQQTIKAHTDALAERDKQLADLKKSAGDNAELTAKISALQAENKTKDEQHQQEMKELRINTAIKLSLTGKTHDADLVAGLLDKGKIELADDGSVKAGLKEQIESLQKSKAFLFVPEKPDTPPVPLFKGAAPADSKDRNPGEPPKADFPFNFQTVRPIPDGKTS